MMDSSDLDVLIPVLGRPHRVQPVLHSVLETAPDAKVMFICSPDDDDEIAAVAAAVAADFGVIDGGYAAKINWAVRMTQRPLLFFGADDLEFHEGWFELAVGKLRDEIQVVGVNDLCSQRVQDGKHATHFLVAREYALLPLLDGKRGPLCEEYDHSCVDDELWATARHREVLAVSSDSIVEHLHPDVGKAEWDDTYESGRARIRRDRRRFLSRSSLWM